MTSRIIWIFRNNEHCAAAPRSALSTGSAHAARPVVLPQRGRAALPSFPPQASSSLARGNLAFSRHGKMAPLFDATAERWIVQPSGTTPDAVAPADQACPIHPHTSPAAVPSAAGTFLHAAAEAFTVALGLTVFGLVAGVLLVLT